MTLHPISKEEINYSVIKPFLDRSLVDKQIGKLSKDDEHTNCPKETYDFSFDTYPTSQHNDCLNLNCLSAIVELYV